MSAARDRLSQVSGHLAGSSSSIAPTIKCEERTKKPIPETTTFNQNQDTSTWLSQPDRHGATPDKYMPAVDVKHLEVTFYEKMKAAHLRNVPKGVLSELQSRAQSGKDSKTADLLLHILWNPMNRQKLIPGCTHQYDDLSQLIDELVALYGPQSSN